MYNEEKAKIYANRWLPTWSGNKPLELANFYSDECYYMDAGCPDIINGKDELIK